jgi:hypothetical protein
VCLLASLFAQVQQYRIILMLTMLVPIGTSILDRCGLPVQEKPTGTN